MPISVSASVKPTPMPSPSNTDASTPFLLANASARARMMQFTTISGMKMPRLSYKSGRYACIRSCTIVTNVQMITMNAGMRTWSGMNLRSIEIAALEPISTNVAAAPMPRPFSAQVVTASVGHVPSTSRKVGFSVITPFRKTFPRRFFSSLTPSSPPSPSDGRRFCAA